MSKKSSLQQVIINNWIGVNTNLRPDRLKPNELAEAMNVYFEDDGSIQQRPGSNIKQTLDTNVNLHNWKEIRDGAITEHLVAAGGSYFYEYNSGAGSFSTVSSTLTSGDTYVFQDFIDKLIFSNGKAIFKYYYDSSTSTYKIADISSTPNIPIGMLLEEFNNRLFIAKDGTENIYWSAVGDPESWASTDFIALSAMPTALLKVGEFLFVGTSRGLYKIYATGDSSVPFAMTHLIGGYIVENSLVEVRPGIVGCLTKEGKFLLFNQYVQTASQIDSMKGFPIENIIKNIRNDSSINTDDFSSFFDTTTKQVIFNLNINGLLWGDDAINNAQLVLNPNLLAWSFWDMSMKSAADFDGELYYSDYNKNVLLSDDNLMQDNSVDIDSYIVTPIFSFNRPDVHKNFRSLYMASHGKTVTEYKVEYATMFNITFPYELTKNVYSSSGIWGSATWGSFVWGEGTLSQVVKTRLDVSGKGLQLKISKNSDNSDFQIQELIFDYYVSYRKGSLSSNL